MHPAMIGGLVALVVGGLLIGSLVVGIWVGKLIERDAAPSPVELDRVWAEGWAREAESRPSWKN